MIWQERHDRTHADQCTVGRQHARDDA
jgi:hypothetical protein